MNLLILSELFYPLGSGAEVATRLYTELLSEAGFNIVVVTNEFAGEPRTSRKGKVTFYRLPLLKANDSVKFSTLRRPDILISNFMRKLFKWADIIYIPRLWFSAIPLAKIYGKPVIVHLHDYIPLCPLSNALDLSKDQVCTRHSRFCPPRCIYVYEKMQGKRLTKTVASIALNLALKQYASNFLRFCDTIICVSENQADMIASQTQHLAPKIKVIHNPLPETSHIPIEGDDFGYFGGPDYVKGFQVLARARLYQTACGARHDSKVETATVHAAKFTGTDRKLVTALNRLGFKLYGKLDNRSVEFEKLYRQIRTVVVPSICHEPWPYVVVEAMLRGRFIVASNIGGIPEQVKGCKGAILCKPGNHAELAEALAYAGSLEREKTVDLGLQNKETFLKNFNNEKTVKDFVEVCESLI